MSTREKSKNVNESKDIGRTGRTRYTLNMYADGGTRFGVSDARVKKSWALARAEGPGPTTATTIRTHNGDSAVSRAGVSPSVSASVSIKFNEHGAYAALLFSSRRH